MDRTQSPQGVLKERHGVQLVISATVAGVSVWMVELMLAAPAGRTRQLGLGAGILLGVMGLGGMTTAVAREYEEVRD